MRQREQTNKDAENLTNLVDVMQSNDGVKQSVEIIQQINHLDGLTESWDGGETHNVTKVQSDLVEVLWFDWFARLQCLGYWPAGEQQIQIISFYKSDVHDPFLLISVQRKKYH